MNYITYFETLSGDTETPVSLFLKLVGENVGFLLESKELPRGRYSFIAGRPYMELIKKNGQMIKKMEEQECDLESSGLEALRQELKALSVINTTGLPFSGGAVGTVGYDMIREIEYLPNVNEDIVQTPESHMLFIREFIAYDHLLHQIYIVALDEKTEKGKQQAQKKIKEIKDHLNNQLHPKSHQYVEPTKAVFTSNMSKNEYIKAVDRIKKYIYDGDIFQTVLSRRLTGPLTDEPFNLYRKLRQVNPSSYMYYFNMGDYQIVGSSPEMLVSVKNGIIQNCPIAGTRKLAETEEENLRLEKELISDEKELAEHRMLVDLGRNDMGKVSAFGSVTVPNYMEVHRYSHVMHIVSMVEGIKRDDVDVFNILMSFLPAGTLSGAPKIRAMEIIDELEVHKRGIYGGAIGYFDFTGNMDMCIAIRTMVIKDELIHMQAGSGIVADSDPLSEFEETNNKLMALKKAVIG